MSTHALTPSRVDAALLDSLVTDGVAEGRQLEYKEQLLAERDDKGESLRDVSAFANSTGGRPDLRHPRGSRRPWGTDGHSS